MPTVRLEAQLSTGELLRAAEQLNLPELGDFVSEVIVLWAKRLKPRLTAGEKKLLQFIKHPLPEDLRRRYQELIEKRRDEALKSKEYDELLRLTDQVEGIEVKRLEALVELAKLRKTTLSNLIRDLGVQAPTYG